MEPFVSERTLNLELKQLRQLCAVAKEGSIAGAARSLSIAQPALSRSIRSAESALGVSLVNRGPRGVELTPYGHILVRYAGAIEANLRLAGQDLIDLEGSAGTVRLGFGTRDGLAVASLAIGRIIERHPHLRVVIREGTPDEMYGLLLAGEIDLTLCGAPFDPHPGIVREHVGLAVQRIVVRAQHPIASKRNVTFADLAKARWIVPPPPSAAHFRFQAVFHDLGLTPPDAQVVGILSPAATVSLLLKQNLVAVVAHPIVDTELQAKRLKALAINCDAFASPAFLAKRDQSSLPTIYRETADELRAAFGELNVNPPERFS
jgi:DNA-binding transcriptional LysR family regulator